MSDSVNGYGTTLKVRSATASTSSSNYTSVGNIQSIDGPNQGRNSIDVSTMESTSRFREFLPGALDAGELTCEMNYDGTASGTADALNTLYASTATNWEWTIQFLDNTSTPSKFASIGHLTALGFAVPSFDDKVSQSLSLKLTGVPTYTDIG